ncbi:hypothetical protein DS742_18240 [Lacrimispora amygdalina]|uniref:Uncharacterized protein n=1 Tax=Lacrimispora amygdalina TaxID=253257 RepID=A0A3E2N935_9FIRM|nr:hypothetical protein DS742_18240 [Clostridium indicum]
MRINSIYRKVGIVNEDESEKKVRPHRPKTDGCRRMEKGLPKSKLPELESSCGAKNSRYSQTHA